MSRTTLGETDGAEWGRVLRRTLTKADWPDEVEKAPPMVWKTGGGEILAGGWGRLDGLKGMELG